MSDQLNDHRVGRLMDPEGDGVEVSWTVVRHLDFDEFVGVQRLFDRVGEIVKESTLPNLHHGMKMMAERTQIAPIFSRERWTCLSNELSSFQGACGLLDIVDVKCVAHCETFI